jgi:hypothetical protein
MAIVDDMFEIRKNSNSYILCFMTNVPTLNFPFSGKTQLVLGVQNEKKPRIYSINYLHRYTLQVSTYQAANHGNFFQYTNF